MYFLKKYLKSLRILYCWTIVIRLFAERANCPVVGGQAVIEGVMIRNGNIYSIAVRKPNGEIYSHCSVWKSISHHKVLKLPFVRGFPILLETLINGIKALNLSATIAEDIPEKQPRRWEMIISLLVAIAMAIALFIIAPHLLSMIVVFMGLSGDVDQFSFHFWDGLFKCAIFIAYIWLISLVPEIKRVFEYHGAEHKTIHAWEEDADLINACRMSRLHPRCGTTFLLFVICISIILQAILLPLLLFLWSPQNLVARHSLSIVYKLILIVPISSCAYELIRFAARLQHGWLSAMLQAPGLALQRLTTREPDNSQLEVAAIALKEAISDKDDFAPGI